MPTGDFRLLLHVMSRMALPQIGGKDGGVNQIIEQR